MIAAALYAQILADSALLPLPYKPMMFDAGGLVPVDVELPRPRAVRTERAAEAVSENAAPVIAPAGISDETGRESDPVPSTNGPIVGVASGPPSAIEGTGSLEAVLDAQGHVESVRVLRSIPLLDQAAVDAVQLLALHARAAQRRAGAGGDDGDRQLRAAGVTSIA